MKSIDKVGKTACKTTQSKSKETDKTKQKKRCNSEWCEYCRVNGSNEEQKGRKKEHKNESKI